MWRAKYDPAPTNNHDAILVAGWMALHESVDWRSPVKFQESQPIRLRQAVSYSLMYTYDEAYEQF